MKKKDQQMFYLAIAVIAAIIAIFLLISNYNNQDNTASLNDLQIQACNTADQAGTCQTRLPEVGIVLAEDCCEALGKCC